MTTRPIETVEGTENDDVVSGWFLNNLILYGYGGDDRLFGGRGYDLLYGGDGDDLLIGGDTGGQLYGGDGDDTLKGSFGEYELYGGEGNDNLNGGNGDDTLKGGTGNDILDDSWGDDYLYGGAGDDTLSGGGDDDYIYGGIGDDTLNGEWDDDTIDGGPGDDTIDGGPGDDTIDGGPGDDTIDGGPGDDTIDGGPGDDTIDGGPGDDTIDGGRYIYGGTGDDSLYGTSNGDTIEGGSGDDTLRGGPGDDIFVYRTQGFGKDVIKDFDVREDKLDFRGSGLGFSDLKFSWSKPDTVLVDAGAGNQIELVAISGLLPPLANIRSAFLFDPVSQSQQVQAVEPEVSIGDGSTLEGAVATLIVELSDTSERDITVYFSASVGTAGIGDYSGVGQPQEITFKAGEISKVIEIDTTDDTDHEGTETFTVELSNPDGATLGSKHTATVTILDDDAPPVVEPPESEAVPSGTEPESEDRLPLEGDTTLYQSSSQSEAEPPAGTMAADTMDGTSGADTLDCLAGNDIARGLGGNDRLWGRLGADTLYGNAGADCLWGNRGQDELHGGVGKDHLYGGVGDDTLYGGRLADELHGGRGDDILSGGHGRDRFVYDDADFGRDRIVDFEDGRDLLDFTGSGLQWSDLSVSNNGKGHAVVRVEGSDSKIVLEGVDASLIGQDDFIF